MKSSVLTMSRVGTSSVKSDFYTTDSYGKDVR